MATLDLQVGASADDIEVYWTGSAWAVLALTFGYFESGYWDGANYKEGGGVRFLNVTIPKGSIITAAYLTFTCRVARSATTVNTHITGDKEVNAATFSTLADYQARRGTQVGGANDNLRTSAQVAWDGLVAQTVDTEYNSPEIKTVIQEIIDQAAWDSGNALVLFWDDHAGRSSATNLACRTEFSYDGSAAKAPKLHIEYAPPQTLSPSGISQALAYGTPTVEVGAGGFTIQPSSIVQVVAIGAPALLYPQILLPSSIVQAIAYGTPSVGIVGQAGFIYPQSIVQQISIGSPAILKYVWHVILDGQYATETPGVNRAYIIGRDQYGNPVYGTASEAAEIALVGERLDFQPDPAIPTTAQAGDVASAVLSKMRLRGKGGVILIPPNCGQELFDVVQISDAGANQSAVTFRVVGIRFEYNPRQAQYFHKLILGAP